MGTDYGNGTSVLSFRFVAKTLRTKFSFEQRDINWPTVIGLLVMHTLAFSGLIFIPEVKLVTILYGWILANIAGLGITAGAHRLWAHRSYKAKLPLEIFLIFCNTLAVEVVLAPFTDQGLAASSLGLWKLITNETFLKSLLHWCRDHRVHHKFTETDADPHNARRGFFFAHMGWLMLKKHPDVINKGKTVDLSDLENNQLLQFQNRYYTWLILIVSIILPTLIPIVFWDERPIISFLYCVVMRAVLIYHITWSVNSAAHIYGNRPYDKSINPRENLLVSWLALGEGFHNYHHVFPWDYSTSEFGIKLNVTTMFINTMAWLGQAYDLKKVNDEEVRKRAMRTGDHHDHSDTNEDDLKQS